ncbi:MAG: peptidoglycan DD-metalloendopeptidase family protein [Neisseriaceae bacterium]|nr:peptidoglycan DD-metalloendopeptidase family protein [Neisseriaceae bacterium]
MNSIFQSQQHIKLGIVGIMLISLVACSTQKKPETIVEKPAPVYPISDDGFYTVKAGDTLSHISVHFGRSIETLKCWNNISNKDILQIGQKIRVMPYKGKDAKKCLTFTESNKSKEPPKVEPPVLNKKNKVYIGVQPVWPVKGNVVSSFNGTTQKGIDIAGKEGQSIQAIADGMVVYAGEELKGYGKLIVLRHNHLLMSTYSHNKNLVVGVGRQVKKGQKIAEMGRDKNGQSILHLEMLINNKPANPALYLP